MAGQRNLGEQMRLLRKANGLTQTQVAEILNIHRTTYTAYETNKNTPDILLLQAFAAIFGVSVDFVLHIDIRKMEVLCDGVEEYDTGRSETLFSTLTPDEQKLVGEFRLLSENDRAKLLKSIEAKNPFYKNKKKPK